MNPYIDNRTLMKERRPCNGEELTFSTNGIEAITHKRPKCVDIKVTHFLIFNSI